MEARDIAYSQYQSRELDLLERSRELEERGFDIDEVLLFRRIDKAFKDQVLAWLKQANGAAQFGDSTWAPMHSGGTSVVPHCRPHGLKKTVKKGKETLDEYYAKLDCAPSSKKPDIKTNVVESFLFASVARTGAGPAPAPTAAELYAALTKKVNAL